MALTVRGWGYSAAGRIYPPLGESPPSLHRHADPERLVVVTWNIAYGYGPGSEAHDYRPRSAAAFGERLAAIGALLRQLGPDIALLQEVDFQARRSHRVDQALALQTATGLPYAAAAVGWSARYVPYPPWPPTHHVGAVASGGVVLSRLPILRQKILHHPRPAGHPFWYNAFYLRRYSQAVQIQLGGRQATVINSHLEDADAANRLLQAERLAALAASCGEELLLLGGDLNADPADPALAVLRRLGEVHELTAARPGAEAPLTFPSTAPTVCLDHLFAVRSWAVDEVGVVGAAGDLSDHLPVRAVLRRNAAAHLGSDF
jgi:endonuclease/exonuclease/phosphatase family metal-dependent hydrolase